MEEALDFGKGRMSDFIFVSSVQKELRAERQAVRDFVRGDALLRRFFDVFLFEDLPASDRRADNVYLDEVARCGIYLGLLGNEYGGEDAAGVSPTEREFDHATARGKVRLIFVKGALDAHRHPKMRSLMSKAGTQLIRRRFTGIPDLTAALYASLVEHLERTGKLRTRPFDAAACPDATLADISPEKVKWFLGMARRERQYPLGEGTPPAEALAHLNLLDAGQPSYAAMLLFGSQPQRFLLSSEVKCLHFHGTEVRKPIPSYQVYQGTVFELVDQAVDFVMSKITRAVGTRAKGPQAPVEYELPREAVAEALVNAVAHRDYTSNASVQVMLFADRLEVWNPGELPPALTLAQLRVPHPSIPHNPLISEPLFLARYIERAGTGTLDMIARCREVGLPEPEFRQDGGQFVITLWRDWLTQKAIDALGLNERQKQAVALVRKNGRITNREYQALAGITDRTALRDFEELTAKGVLEKRGTTGRSIHYVLRRQTRHKPDKADTGASDRGTRHKPDKGDTR
ncbi:MAG: ATP-binding protein [Candidatus Rokubacteria bacterium]|nr:ATP-binding protein [Candidatus Rokubacteria bacterium]